MNGRGVKEARETLGLTQVQFGAALGICQSAVWRLEAGKRAVTPSRSQSIKNLLRLQQKTGEKNEEK